jgi:cytochrome c oxidase subunit 2
MGTEAKSIAIAYSIITVVALGIAFGIWRSTRPDRKPLDEELAAERENTWLGMVIAFLVATLIATMLFVPYGESAGPGKQVVRVQAQQFAFTVTPAKIVAGRPVEFVLTSKDTTHGFGVTTDNYDLLFQAQIAPEHTQLVVHTFKTPGIYRIVCLEYCGVGHHTMLSQFEVTQ